MTSLLSKILETTGLILRNEELHPKRENLRILSKNGTSYNIQIKIKFLWICYIWSYLTYEEDVTGEEKPIVFDKLSDAIHFINEVCEK